MTLRIVCLSDTHGRHERLEVPDGDVLVHAGDFTSRGRPAEVEAFAAFLARLPHRHKICVAGNHDFLFEREPARARAMLAGVATYLEDEGCEVEGLGIWGSPWQPWFHDWAFNLPRGPALAERWALVPEGVDLLVTHGPPEGILDRTWSGASVGCADLCAALERIVPAVHLFGHIHEARGVERRGRTLFVNASVCDVALRAVRAPVVLEWDGERAEVVGA